MTEQRKQTRAAVVIIDGYLWDDFSRWAADARLTLSDIGTADVELYHLRRPYYGGDDAMHQPPPGDQNAVPRPQPPADR